MNAKVASSVLNKNCSECNVGSTLVTAVSSSTMKGKGALLFKERKHKCGMRIVDVSAQIYSLDVDSESRRSKCTDHVMTAYNECFSNLLEGPKKVNQKWPRLINMLLTHGKVFASKEVIKSFKIIAHFTNHTR